MPANIWRRQPTNRIKSSNLVRNRLVDISVIIVNKFFEVVGGTTCYGLAILLGAVSLVCAAKHVIAAKCVITGTSVLTGIVRLSLPINIWRKQPTNRLQSSNLIRKTIINTSVLVVNKFFESVSGITQYCSAVLSSTGRLTGEYCKIYISRILINIWRRQPTSRLQATNLIRKTPIDASVIIINRFFEVAIEGITHYCSAILSSLGSLTGIGVRLFSAKSTLTGEGAITTIGRRIFAGVSTLIGVGTIAAISKRILVGVSNLTGVGAIIAIGRQTFAGMSILTGAGSVAALGRRISTVVSKVIGAGMLAAIGGKVVTSISTLIGVGTLTGIGSRIRGIKNTLTGYGTIAAIGRQILAGVSTLIGAGMMTSIGGRIRTGISTLIGSGTLLAIGIIYVSAILLGITTIVTAIVSVFKSISTVIAGNAEIFTFILIMGIMVGVVTRGMLGLDSGEFEVGEEVDEEIEEY